MTLLCGTEYLLDRLTMRAYHVPRLEGHWPKLAGQVEGEVDQSTGAGGRLVPAKSMEGLMAALDAELKTKQQRWGQANVSNS
jgi:hypothetical protein